MYGHRSFLMLGSANAANIMTLLKGGNEISHCEFTLQQGIDSKGKATTRVYGGLIRLTLAQLPSEEVLRWAIKPKKYIDGAVITVDNENIPVEKIVFKNAICSEIEVDYSRDGDEYTQTRLSIQAESLIPGDGDELNNEWAH